MSGEPKVSPHAAIMHAAAAFSSLARVLGSPMQAVIAMVDVLNHVMPEKQPAAVEIDGLADAYRLHGLSGAIGFLHEAHGDEQVRLAVMDKDDAELLDARYQGRVEFLARAVAEFEADDGEEGDAFDPDQLATLVSIIRRLDARVAPYQRALQPPEAVEPQVPEWPSAVPTTGAS